MPGKENEDRSSLSKCTKSISLVLIGSALFLSGCSRQARCPPQDPNCQDPTRSSSSGGYRGGGGVFYGGGVRGGGGSPGVSSGASPGGGFGSTGAGAGASAGG